VTLVDRRIGLLFLAFTGLLGLAAVRALELGTLKAGGLRSAAKTQQAQTITLPAPRGTITDRNGVQLAISEAADDVAADPLLMRKADPAGAARKLAPLLGKPAATVEAQVTKPRTGFVYLAHFLPADVARQIAALRINGITLIPQVKRVYPRGSLASQVLGNVGWNGKGSSGIEYRYDTVLHGKNGLRQIVNAGNGQPISIDERRPTDAGEPLQLTVDTALQDEVEQVLGGVGSQYQPKGATAIVMDPRSGAILALANWPKADPANPAGASPAAFSDQAVGFNYEPGSTFKAFTVAGALQDGLVTPSSTLPIPSQLVVADRVIHDAESHGDESLSVAEILKVSSNIGADEIGAKLGPQRFDGWVRRFGFGAPTGVDLPGEGRGIVLHSWQYSGTSMANLPFGQGESVTPMQMVAAYAAIANGGVLRTPHIVKSVAGKRTRASAGRRIISPTVSEQLRGMLRGVLADGGTASGAAIPGYDLSGKTGTANIAVNGQYSGSEFVASFMGMVPASNPRLVVAVVVNQPHGSIYGGSVAAPAFQKIVGWAVPYFGINPR
jgi:cell division protein FtsI/penicillin-binding protein 2